MKRQAHEEAQVRVTEQDERLRALEVEMGENSAAERSVMTGTISVPQLRAYSRYFHHLSLEGKAGAELRSALEKERVGKQGELVEASRERKGLEEYREKLRVRHEKESEKIERSELDEIAAQRFVFDRRQSELRG